MQLVFSDAQFWESFLPLSFTRPIAEMRCGVLTFSERWQKLLNTEIVAYLTEDYLQVKFPKPADGECLFIVPNFLPSEKIVEDIKDLKLGEALVYENELLAARVNLKDFSLKQIEKMTEVGEPIIVFKKPTDLFTYNDAAIDFDFKLLTEGRQSQPLSSTNSVIGDPQDIFIEEGAEVEYAMLNAKTGKIYIGKDAKVMEGSMVRGPLALCEHAELKMGAKIYGATTVGPYCKFGGEVGNSIAFGYSSKGHDGYLGNSVLGEWCNMGADTNTSNLKNNYSHVRLWDYRTKDFADTGLQFCGTIMGDHSKTAINTQLNTGTTVGVASNIFQSGFPPNLVENFSWGGASDSEKYRIDKALEVAERVMARRNITLSDADRSILTHISENF